MFRALLCLACLATPALAEDKDDDHVSSAGGVTILHAWTNATDEDHANIYMDIENEGESDITLVGAMTEIGSEIILVATKLDGSGATEEVGPFPISAGAEQHLEPDAIFFHVEGVNTPLIEGEEFEMVVVIDPVGEIEVHVEIEDADARAHSHAGHAH